MQLVWDRLEVRIKLTASAHSRLTIYFGNKYVNEKALTMLITRPLKQTRRIAIPPGGDNKPMDIMQKVIQQYLGKV